VEVERPGGKNRVADQADNSQEGSKQEGIPAHWIGVIVLLLKVGCCSRMLRRG
jgi:hypothetical protein